jgi:Holliday junction resolvase-like predicted endonuclease
VEVNKSTRHQKIIGELGEMLVCNWLSRSGFEATVVDHTGIDIIAFHPLTTERYGISVKARTRARGKETETVTIFSRREDRQKIVKACEAFNCVPWIAIYVETTNDADLYITSLKNFEEKYCKNNGLETISWKMNFKDKQLYKSDLDIKNIHIDFSTNSWWK